MDTKLIIIIIIDVAKTLARALIDFSSDGLDI